MARGRQRRKKERRVLSPYRCVCRVEIIQRRVSAVHRRRKAGATLVHKINRDGLVVGYKVRRSTLKRIGGVSGTACEHEDCALCRYFIVESPHKRGDGGLAGPGRIERELQGSAVRPALPRWTWPPLYRGHGHCWRARHLRVMESGHFQGSSASQPWPAAPRHSALTALAQSCGRHHAQTMSWSALHTRYDL
jgi:hypothetical protein